MQNEMSPEQQKSLRVAQLQIAIADTLDQSKKAVLSKELRAVLGIPELEHAPRRTP